MMEKKAMIGHKVRRFRLDHGLNQTEMAAQLSISPSYLNLIEHNQRPVTVPLLFRLSQAFEVDLREFAEDDDGMFDWQQRRARWNDVLSQLAEEFRSGRADPSPVHRIQTCRNCKLEPLCRIDEKGDLL